MIDTVPLGVFDYTNEQYHAGEGISRSKLWTYKQLPSKYWYQYESGKYQRPEDKEAFILGDLVHTRVLEPHLFEERFIEMPHIDRRTKQGKLDYEEFQIKAAGKSLVKPDMIEHADAMVQSLLDNSTVSDLIQDAQYEKSIYWEHKPTGIICKARPDIWNGKIVSDLKTTLDAGYRGFQMSAFKHGYFLQAAMIYEALKSIGQAFDTFVFICVEKAAPYSVGLYMLDDEALQFGLDQFHMLMERFAESKQTNNWPDYGVQKLCIPKYATLEVEHE